MTNKIINILLACLKPNYFFSDSVPESREDRALYHEFFDFVTSRPYRTRDEQE